MPFQNSIFKRGNIKNWTQLADSTLAADSHDRTHISSSLKMRKNSFEFFKFTYLGNVYPDKGMWICARLPKFVLFFILAEMWMFQFFV